MAAEQNCVVSNCTFSVTLLGSTGCHGSCVVHHTPALPSSKLPAVSTSPGAARDGSPICNRLSAHCCFWPAAQASNQPTPHSGPECLQKSQLQVSPRMLPSSWTSCGSSDDHSSAFCPALGSSNFCQTRPTTPSPGADEAWQGGIGSPQSTDVMKVQQVDHVSDYLFPCQSGTISLLIEGIGSPPPSTVFAAVASMKTLGQT